MTEKRGYYRIEKTDPNIFADAGLSELIRQLESCGYRCEAGPLENNLAYIELRRRVIEQERDKSRITITPLSEEQARDMFGVGRRHDPRP